MADSETLFALGFSSDALPAWTVIMYVAVTSIFVLMRRIQLYLLTTHLFSIYWGFLLYWAGFLVGSNAHTTAFVVYIFCGLAVASLAIIAYFKHSPYDSSIVGQLPQSSLS